MKPRYLQIFESIGIEGAISEVAADNIRAMLNANWHVSIVANQLSKEFQSQVEWHQLYVPKKVFAYKWLTARHYLLKARGKEIYDVTHAHQPQISDSVDIFQCHYLTRAAANGNGLPSWRGRQGVSRFQEEIVLRAEDRFMRRLQAMRGEASPLILFGSELTKDEFINLYNSPQKPEVLPLAVPQSKSLSDEERLQFRENWAPEAGNKIVVGFLGGSVERKGFKRVVKEIQDAKDTYLLWGGPGMRNFDTSKYERVKNVGFVRDKDSFFGACDVFVMASTFEPLGMVGFEAASYGVPVIALPSVGALKAMQPYNAALAWTDEKSFSDLCSQAMRDKEKMRLGTQKFCDLMGRESYNRRLLEACEAIKEAKKSRM